MPQLTPNTLKIKAILDAFDCLNGYSFFEWDITSTTGNRFEITVTVQGREEKTYTSVAYTLFVIYSCVGPEIELYEDQYAPATPENIWRSLFFATT